MSAIKSQVVANYPTGEIFVGGVSRDFNKDGFLDLIYYTSYDLGSGASYPYAYYLTNGSPTLIRQPTSSFSDFVQPWVQRTIAVDLNNDGLLDLVSGAAPEQGNSSRVEAPSNSDSWGAPQYVFIQRPNHTFEPRKVIDGIFEAHSIEVADFNEDGYADILEVSDLQENPIILINNGDATFRSAPLPKTIEEGIAKGTFGTFWAATGDFNNDRHADIAFLGGVNFPGYWNGSPNTPPQNNHVIYYGDGKAGFTEGPKLPIAPSLGQNNFMISCEGSAVIDLNNDGRSDLVLWEIYRDNLNAADDNIGRLRVLINTQNGFEDRTEQWIGSEFDFNVGSDTRSLGPSWLDKDQGILTYTFMATFATKVRMPLGAGPYLMAPVFLKNTGTELKTIIDPYWNEQYLNTTGFSPSPIWGIDASGHPVAFYRNWQNQIVSVTFDFSDEMRFYEPKTNFYSVDLNAKTIRTTSGQPYQDGLIDRDITTGDWQSNTQKFAAQKGIADYYSFFNDGGFHFRLGTIAHDMIDVMAGNNIIDGLNGANVVRTGSGNDFIIGRNDGSVFEGGSGNATVIYGGQRSNYNITPNGDGSVSVNTPGRGSDTLYNIDTVAFSNGVFSVSNGALSPVAQQIPFQWGTISLDRLALSDGSIFDGMDQADVAGLTGKASEYKIEQNDHVLFLTRNGTTTTLINVERVLFNDGIVAFDIEGNAGQAYRLYQASLDRTPDVRGLSGWIKFMDEGGALTTMAQQFIDSQEFKTKYGELNDRNFVNQLYLNVLDRNGEPAGIDGWVGGLTKGLSRADVLKGFSESAENQGNVFDIIKNGISYSEWWLS